ncbi:MAG: hypothetical protein JXB05_20295 [Myxococcaceae bacterium]|nr:hypothetical protein [Myxococcaceae bacterium]
MRKAIVVVAGIAGLSLLLCGSEALLAQTDTPARGTGTGGAGSTQVTGGAGASTAELQESVLELQSEVAQLRQELAEVRAALADVSASAGVGGSGQAGVDANAGVGGSGQAGVTPPVSPSQRTPLRAGTAQETTPSGAMAQDTSNAGEAVVNAIYTGTVRSVSGRQLELLDEDGQPFTMQLGDKTRVLRDGKLISARQLKQGTRVRVTVDLVSPGKPVMEITTLPAQ